MTLDSEGREGTWSWTTLSRAITQLWGRRGREGGREGGRERERIVEEVASFLESCIDSVSGMLTCQSPLDSLV